MALLLGACSDDGDGSGAAPASTTTTTAGAGGTTTAPAGATVPGQVTTTAPAPASAPAGPGLRPDGLGVARLGEAEHSAVAGLTGAFGPPDADRPVDSDACGTGADREVRWSGLTAWFGDEADERVFYGWRLARLDGGLPAGPALTTAEGVGVGATVAELRAAYGSALTLGAGSGGAGAGFTVRDAEGHRAELSGLLTGADDSGTVTAFSGGLVCAPDG